MKYKVVTAGTPADLEENVNFLLSLGYVLQGGVSTNALYREYHVNGDTETATDYEYAQALVSHEV